LAPVGARVTKNLISIVVFAKFVRGAEERSPVPSVPDRVNPPRSADGQCLCRPGEHICFVRARFNLTGSSG